MAAHRRPIPDDWEEHWHEPFRKLHDRYQTDSRTIAKWRLETGHPVHNKRPILQYAEDGTFITRFESIAEAKRKCYVGYNTVRDCARGKTKCGLGCGFIWRYEDAEIQGST